MCECWHALVCVLQCCCTSLCWIGAVMQPVRFSLYFPLVLFSLLFLPLLPLPLPSPLSSLPLLLSFSALPLMLCISLRLWLPLVQSSISITASDNEEAKAHTHLRKKNMSGRCIHRCRLLCICASILAIQHPGKASACPHTCGSASTRLMHTCIFVCLCMHA